MTASDAGARSGQVAVFHLGDEEFAVDIQRIQEIVRPLPVTIVPQAPPFIQGLANLRGSILPIVDLRGRFGLPEIEPTEATRIVVADLDGNLLGFVVDDVSEVMSIPAAAVEPPPSITIGVAADYLEGVAKLDDGNRLLMMLAIERILDAGAVATLTAGDATALDTQTARREVTQAQEAEDEEQLVTFRLAEEEYALSIHTVQEVIRLPPVTHVPHAPAYVRGVIALRERLVPVIDLRARFALPPHDIDDTTRVVVTKLNGATAGLVVDAVSEVMRLPKSSIDAPPPIIYGSGRQQLRGMGKLDEGRRLILLLDVDHLFSAAEQEELGQLEDQVEGDEVTGAGQNGQVRSDAELLDTEQLVSFQLDEEEFGVHIHQVREIVRLSSITKVPHAPSYVEGVLNLRGNVLPVVDLGERLGLSLMQHTEATRIVVLDIAGVSTGIVVDRVTGVLRMPLAAIEPPPPVIGGVAASFVEGVGKLDGGERMVVLLKTDEVVV